MINKVILIGNLGGDPELKTFESNTTKLNLSVATEEYYEKNGEPTTLTTWHDVSIWGEAAKRYSEYLKKGDKVYVEGKLIKRKWRKKDEAGNPLEETDRTQVEINAHTIRKVGWKPTDIPSIKEVSKSKK